ncbi:protein kinase domain-containing protein [Sorangium sp. So ce131]|uniref:serine/threonine-protein kinase n=1 Tax=Sorangium sp. So ce131 TaxID=3133282 RepID=UPI003F630130
MRPGDLVGDRFRIERPASEGGMGAVYRAQEIHTGAEVALKLLRGATSDAEVQRFAREARVLAELSHPGIVRYVGHGLTGTGEPYLAMEWLDGQDLGQRLQAGVLSIRECVVLAARVAEALAAAHARGVTHRDIKPRNLFLPGGDVARVKVVDFGIARRRVETRSITGTNVFVGTPSYAAPEQVRGDEALGPQADVFSLGCVLFESLAGRPPFEGGHLMAVFARILFDEPPHLCELRDDVPQALGDLVTRMLAKEPAERPADGAEVAAALAAVDPAGPTGRPGDGVLPAALSRVEQRLVSVLVAGAIAGAGANADAGADADPDANANADVDAETVPARADLARADLAPLDRLRAIASSLAVRVDRLADGSAIAAFAGSASATDLAVLVARCALSLRAALPDVPVVLATGRCVLEPWPPAGEVIDRAVNLLRAEAPASEGASAARRPRPIRLDEVTAGLLDPRFELGGEPGAPELSRERDPEDATRKLLGKPTPCVGRQRELSVLEGFWSECVSESVARVVLVTGPPGMGKSRLRSEFVSGLRRRASAGAARDPASAGPSDAPPEIWIARGDPLRAGSPLGMVGQLVRRAAQLLEGEPLAIRQEKLAARVGRRVGRADAARVTELLGELAGAPFPDDDGAKLRAARGDPALLGDQIRRAFQDFLRAECAARPVLLVLEDLHWGDAPSVQLVEAALGALQEQPLMVMALARPEVHAAFPKLWVEAGAQEIRLGKLSPKAGRQLAHEVLAGRAPEERIDSVVEQAEGNALVLEELIRAAAHGADQGAEHALPATVLAMMHARLEALEAEARQILRAGSVFGEVFWTAGVSALLGGAQGADAVRARLAALVERELVVRREESKLPGQEEHAFRHALVREAAYGTLTEHDRALGHRLAGAWLERMGERDAVTLAKHFERGGDRARAAFFHDRAAEQAGTRRTPSCAG